MGEQREAPDEGARLAGRFQAGDRDAFKDIYLLHIGRVNRYLRAALHNESDVQDVAQHVFESVFAALPSYRSNGSRFENWLLRIVRNEAIDHLRRNRRTAPHDPEDMVHYLELRNSKQALEALEWGTSERLHSLMDKLPLAQRQILVLHYLLGMTGVEIAQVLGRSAACVRQLHHRALSTLEDRLGAPRRTGQRTLEVSHTA